MDNATDHHDFAPEVKVFESNTNAWNTDLVCKYRVQKIKVKREVNHGKRGKQEVELFPEVPPAGLYFRQVTFTIAINREEVAHAIPVYFQRTYP